MEVRKLGPCWKTARDELQREVRTMMNGGHDPVALQLSKGTSYEVNDLM